MAKGADNPLLDFAEGEAGARRLAGVFNRLLTEIGLLSIADEIAGGAPAKWTDAFMDALNPHGCTAATALAALALGKSDPEAAQAMLIRMLDRRQGRS